jgi:UDP-3-O-[3-hydroxymyristoyl] glucosamine N-acyltransferase
MADPRFYSVSGPFDILQLASFCDAEVGGPQENGKTYSDIAPLDIATSDHVSFIDNRKYVSQFEETNAGAIVVAPDLVDRAPGGAALLIAKDPYRAYALIAQKFYPFSASDADGKVAATATVSKDAKVGKNVTVRPGVVIKDNVEIGDNSYIGDNSVLEESVIVGADSRICSNVTLQYCVLGANAIIHPGVRIGQDGYGFAPSADGHVKVPQLGRVVIGEHVEIGANSCIDRGALGDTEIGDGTKLDNLVHIAHNVKIGQGCFITGQVGIAGSSTVGDFVMMGGQAGISGHVAVGHGARVAAQAGVSKDIPAGETVAGYPAINARQFWRSMAALNKLAAKKE